MRERNSVRAMQFYLLSQMRNSKLIAAVLDSEGIAFDDARRLGVAFAEDAGISAPVHRADAYVKALGPPEHEQVIAESELQEPFVGSTRLWFRLPLWPKVFFEVSRDREGYAWGNRFSAGPVMPVCPLPATVVPWDFAEGHLRHFAYSEEQDEAWGLEFWEGDLTFISDGEAQEYHAVFDLGLLQSWVQI